MAHQVEMLATPTGGGDPARVLSPVNNVLGSRNTRRPGSRSDPSRFSLDRRARPATVTVLSKRYLCPPPPSYACYHGGWGSRTRKLPHRVGGGGSKRLLSISYRSRPKRYFKVSSLITGSGYKLFNKVEKFFSTT